MCFNITKFKTQIKLSKLQLLFDQKNIFVIKLVATILGKIFNLYENMINNNAFTSCFLKMKIILK
jgi:hypothetical protein